MWDLMAAHAAGDVSADACQEGLEKWMDQCFQHGARGARGVRHGTHVYHCSESDAAAACRDELQLWHASWQRQRGAVRTLDLNNGFGWHALPADDAAFRSEAFVEEWAAIARSGCRGTGDDVLPVANGPLLRSSRLVTAVERLLPRSHALISVTGCGTEAVLAFYQIGNAFLSARRKRPVRDCQLLFFKGSYVGGALGLQGANGVDFIARQAFAPTCVGEDCLIEGAPYTRDALALLARACHGWLQRQRQGRDDARGDHGVVGRAEEGDSQWGGSRGRGSRARRSFSSAIGKKGDR